MFSFANDVDGLPNSKGEYTGASLTKPDMPRDFTVCAAFIVEAWTTSFTSAYLFHIDDKYGNPCAYVNIDARLQYSLLMTKIGGVTFGGTYWQALFPLIWVRVCVSLDTVSGNLALVV